MRRILVFLGIASVLLACGAEVDPTASSGSAARPTAAAEPTATVDAAKFEINQLPIESVDVQVRETMPVQVAVVVKGYLNDSCTTLHNIAQQRDGQTITLTITKQRPKGLDCAQVISEFSETITLEGDFPPGTYTLRVNDMEQTFTV